MRNSGPSRYFSARAWLFLVAGCVLSPFVFVIVQSYMAGLLVPALSVLRVSPSKSVGAAIVVWDMLGAIVAAAILCLPLGWLEPRHPASLGVVVGAVGCIALWWIWSSASPPISGWSFIPELVAFLGGCIVFAIVGAKGARRVAA